MARAEERGSLLLLTRRDACCGQVGVEVEAREYSMKSVDEERIAGEARRQEAPEQVVLFAELLELVGVYGVDEVAAQGARHHEVAVAEAEHAGLLARRFSRTSVLFAHLVIRVHCEELEHEQVDGRGDHGEAEENECEREYNVDYVGQIVSVLERA